MIAILNYGLGNINAFANIYNNLDIPHKIVSNPTQLGGVKKIILPGVGAFDYAMKKLNNSGLRDSVENLVLNEKIPVMGICVGMQILANSSDEGSEKGLGWIDADVKLFDTSNIKRKTKLPHMGWNTINPNPKNLLNTDLNSGARFYFLHSYYFECYHAADIIATTNYGIEFTSAANSDNIYGVQFHPEKSHQNGIKLLSNFSNL